MMSKQHRAESMISPAERSRARFFTLCHVIIAAIIGLALGALFAWAFIHSNP